MGVRSLGEDKIELSAENIMVGLQLFWVWEALGGVLDLSTSEIILVLSV